MGAYDDKAEHFHSWRNGAWGPCEGGYGRYARCECGAQCWVGAIDDKPVGILFIAPDRSKRIRVPVEALV